MADIATTMAEKFQILMSLTPELRSRATVVRKTAFDAALHRRLDIETAKNELELIIKLCEEILSA